MKSTRSQSTKNVRRNARKLISESSDSDNSDNPSNIDSARAEKFFSHRRHQMPVSNSNTSANELISANRTLFRLSSSDSSASHGFDKSEDEGKSLMSDDENTSNNSKNKSSSSFKPSKNDTLKYRDTVQSSDDDVSKSSIYDMSNDTSISNKNVLESNEDNTSEESNDEYIESLKENSSINESIVINPRRYVNKQRKILDSSDESDSEIRQTTPKNTSVDENLINKEINSDLSDVSDNNHSRNIVQGKTVISESDSDDYIVNSSKEISALPVKSNRKKSCIDVDLNNLSLVEPSYTENDTSLHYKSTIASSNQSRPFYDDLKFSNTLQSPICQSSILENSSFNISTNNVSNAPTDKENIEVITLDDTPKISKSVLPKHPMTIDLTGDKSSESSEKSSVLSTSNTSNDLKKLKQGRFESLKMEKKRLEEVVKQYTKNIDNMKVTVKTMNLKLLPDGGLKLKQAILKNERDLKDTEKQLVNVLEKLKEFKDSDLDYLQENPKTSSLNINGALTKKAAANIDVRAMGDKALSTYRAQQAMTVDVLHGLHKSLETCPASNILADDPDGLKVELMPHQKHAIAWLMWRESQKPYGGILADDMGLGKTLTMISLILKSEETEQEDDSDTEDDSFDSTDTIKGGTLIICPASLISQWQNEVKSKLRGGLLDAVQHYGPNRESSARRLARKDIVITTYHVVMWDQKSHQNTSPLFKIKWKRIILDEAHTIRNYKSQTSIAVSALSGRNRWALSGTPIHNKEADFYALLKFIKCSPFDDWAVWKRWVGNNDEAGKNRLSLLVKTLMLRRTKAELNEVASFKLPPKHFHTVEVELFKEEKDAYEKVLLFSSTLFATYLCEKAEKENAVERGFPVQNKVKYLHQQNLKEDVFQDHPELARLFKQFKDRKDIQAHHILVLLLRLRQLCCHPSLMKNMLEDENLKTDGIADKNDLDLIDNMSRMSIGLPKVEKSSPLINSNPIFNDSWVSSKIKSVCNYIEEKVLPTDDKAVIVSQWPSMLLLIRKQLSQFDVKTEMFTGAVPVLLRNKIVGEFNNTKGGPKILLLSLTAGGVGLNLVAANHLFLVDIHWNPQLEAQACDRIYRLGQKKTVNVYKFICTNTIETSIQTIQSNKLQIANNLFGGCRKIAGSSITLDDLKQIFSINPNK